MRQSDLEESVGTAPGASIALNLDTNLGAFPLSSFRSRIP